MLSLSLARFYSYEIYPRHLWFFNLFYTLFFIKFMSLLDRLPKLEKCCICVTDLKVAAAIIAVLGIVTSPMVSWAVVRHMYVVRVSCVVTTSATRPDVVDINMSNALSFGFGVSSGLGPSCLARNTTASGKEKTNAGFVQFVRYSGWMVLITDGIFVISSVNFLVKMFQGQDSKASLIFIIAGLVAIIVSFIYGMLYISACIFVGGVFPVFEFFFSCLDLILWTYYLMVVYSFRQKS